MNDTNYITIQGWMVNRLNLSGNDLICYALIWGFTQDGNFWNSSNSYISSWLNISKRSVIEILKRLVDNNMIEKQEYEVNHVTFCRYKAIVSDFTSGEESPLGGSEESSPHIYSIDNNNKEERDKSLSKKDELFEECWKSYRRKGSKAKSKTYWNKLSNEERKRVLQHIKSYVSVRDLSYQKDFERYLRDKIFDTVIVNGNQIVYDPNCETDLEYHPYGNTSIMWNEQYKCYSYIGYFDGTLCDGYTDDNRPDGAFVRLNNARGTITWSKDEKKWIHKK